MEEFKVKFGVQKKIALSLRQVLGIVSEKGYKPC